MPAAGSVCGSCETKLSDRVDAYLLHLEKENDTIETVIHDLKEIFSSESRELGAKQLNWFVAPYSRSLIKPNPSFPKILIKSPNAEAWMAYGTDPKSEHFQSVELMRWVPGKAKFEFTLIERDPLNGNLNVDRSGTKCVECHTTRLRPIWDSYKAWPGLAPSRDDLLETDPRNPSQLEPLTEYYLAFLKKLKEPRAPKDRLQGLPSPLHSTASLKKDGYLRIPHFPDPIYNLNFSRKTALMAGPSHLAFDQLETLNLCAAADEIRRKHLSPKTISHLARAASWKSTDQPTIKRACAQINGGENCVSSLDQFLRQKKDADSFNIEDRIAKQKETYQALRASGIGLNDADIDFWTMQAKRDLPTDLSVISDPGGVLPVPESDPVTIVVFQYLLKDTGIKVEDWSMSDFASEGPTQARARLSFSDQFASILSKVKWDSMILPTLGSIPQQFPNLMSEWEVVKNDKNTTVVQIRDDQFEAFGEMGKNLAKTILLPNQKNPLDNPVFAIKTKGTAGDRLAKWLEQHPAVRTRDLIAWSNTICNDHHVCYVLLAESSVEEFRSTQRLSAVLQRF